MNLLHYGLQRSGTNFLESLLRQRYKVRIVNRNADRCSALQKHFRLYDDKDKIPTDSYRNNIHLSTFDDFERLLDQVPDYYLIISKDPYSWLLSYRRWAMDHPWPKPSYHYIEEYNLFYGKWLAFAREDTRIKFVRYIDLLSETDKELGRLEQELGLKRRHTVFGSTNRIMRVPQSGRFTESRRKFYEQKEYMAEYSANEMRELNTCLHHDVLRGLGYELQRGKD